MIAAVARQFPDIVCETKVITTKGDRLLDKPLVEFGGKGAFISEIEEKMKNGEIHAAVHSAKDMPAKLEDGLYIAGALERENPTDVLVTTDWKGFLRKEHPVVGTSSLRRREQISRHFPGCECSLLRGNVNTRLKKLKDGLYDGIILASAGLKRLGLSDKAEFQYHEFTADEMVPAGGQGIIVIETKRGSEFADVFSAISDERAQIELKLERRALELLGAGCHEPVGVFTEADLSARSVRIFLFRGKGEPQRAVVSLKDAEKYIEEMARHE